MAPDEFIPIAEENGLIAAIDKWMIYNVCREVSQWDGADDLYATINISASTFTNPGLVELLRGALSSADHLDPRRIKVEVTESQCMSDPKAAVRQIQLLAELGIDVWIDDFGTGHSSLSYLRKLPATIMKIDREFVEELVENPEDMVYLANIISTIRSQHKDVVVEGVETHEQHELLSRLGCSLMQGFFYSKPVPDAEFREVIGRGL
jgi:EAL domain-containing protein (putative c-di-GMP-specific phosphodiesterase class I)